MLTQQQIDELKKREPKTPSGSTNFSNVSADDFLSQIKTKRLQTQQPQEKNVFQKVAGTFLDPMIKLSSEAGNVIGTGIVKGYQMFQSPEEKARIEKNLNKYLSESHRIAGFGTEVPAMKSLSAEQVGGQVLGTAGLLTGNPLVGGAALGAGQAMEQEKGVGGVLMNAAIGAATGKLLEGGFKMAQPHIEKAIAQYGVPAFEKLSAYIPEGLKDTYKTFAEKVTPIIEKGIDKIPEAPFSGGINKLQDTATGLSKGIEKKISNKVKSKIIGLPTTPEEEISKIEELISPKLTSKEIKLAEREGRIIPKKEAGIFTKGKPTTVIPKNKVMSNAPIIQKNIPGAAQMDESQLADELRMKVSEISQKLKPEMEQVTLPPENVSTIYKNWEKLKEKQTKDFRFTDNSGNKRFQKSFEERLKGVTSDTNMDNVWDLVKSYDDSIPESIKNATDKSAPVDIFRKEMWLQNRRILRGAIDNASNGLGDISKKAFKEMSAMLDSHENIISKAHVDTKAEQAKIIQMLKSPAGVEVLKLLGIGGAVAAGIKIGTNK